VTYDALFVNPGGRTPRGQFVPALLVLLAVVLFFAFLVKGRTSMFCLLVLMYPGLVLHARRLRDMGRSAWLLALPAVLLLCAFAIWLKYASFGGQIDNSLPMIAQLVAAAFSLWGAVGKSRVPN
jgi:uncharacterized membrane protein YhaH (DUF805 family)